MRKHLVSVSLAAILLLPVLSGCGGGGGGGGASLSGTWRNVAIGPASSGAAPLTRCPGSVTVQGEQISCGPNDTITFGDNTLRSDSLDDAGNPERVSGTYTRSGNNLTATVSQAATDLNRNGIYEASETQTLAAPIVLNVRIRELTDSRLVLEVNTDGNAFTAEYSR